MKKLFLSCVVFFSAAAFGRDFNCYPIGEMARFYVEVHRDGMRYVLSISEATRDGTKPYAETTANFSQNKSSKLFTSKDGRFALSIEKQKDGEFHHSALTLREKKNFTQELACEEI